MINYKNKSIFVKRFQRIKGKILCTESSKNYHYRKESENVKKIFTKYSLNSKMVFFIINILHFIKYIMCIV